MAWDTDTDTDTDTDMDTDTDTDADTDTLPENDETIIPDPSWTCNSPDGVVPPELGELVLSANIDLGDIHNVGTTQYGTRRILDITGGTFSGDGISGSFANGSLDLELTLSNGAVELEELLMLRTNDNAPIYLRVCGFAAPGASSVRVVPDFEAPNASPYAWLNTGEFAGTRVVNETAGTIELKIYDISAVSPTATQVQLEDPPADLDQPWDCSTQTGARGATVFSASLSLGTSISIGASKYGSRNIIPITGGTTTGQVAGAILFGGADFQLSGTEGLTMDARYTLASGDGELIMVRNCGPMGALVPLFEAPVNGPYAFLNANTWVSSDPSMSGGGVSTTFYVRQ